MGQVTIYLEDEVEEKMKMAAKAAHLSKSKWISRLIREKVMKEWPDSVAEMPGTWSDFTSGETIREELGQDSSREEL